MKTVILAVLAALTLTLGSFAGANEYVRGANSTFPEGSIQNSAGE